MSKKISPQQQSIISASDSGQHATAIVLAKEFLVSDPDNLRTLVDLGHAYWQLARYAEAETTFYKAIEICEPERRDVIYGEMGNLNRARGDFASAKSWFEKQIETDPSDATGHLFLGTMQFRLGELASAQETLSRGIDCEYGCLEELHHTLGLVFAAQDDLASAANHLNQSLRIDPAYAPAKITLKDVKSAMAN